jgi:hypothetical protein
MTVTQETPEVKPTVRRRATTLILALAAFGLIPVLSASCREVVAGNPEDSVSALCDLLTRCYGDDAPPCADLASRFEKAPATTNDDFLGFLTTNSCLTSCSTAKMCWDHAPVCSVAGKGCAHPQDCCGFTRGLSACDGNACCIPRGVQCGQDGDRSTCCGGDPCFSPIPGQPATCGGVPPCANGGDPCSDDFACCSKQCGDNGTCVDQKTCSDEGGPCLLDGDCCSDLDLACVKDSMGNGHCTSMKCEVTTACAAPGGPPVLACDPHGTDSCCGQPNLCIADETGQNGVCADLTQYPALPDGFDCTTDDDCCSGHCDRSSIPVCAEAQTMCTVFDPTCFVEGTNCPANCSEADPTTCCSGECKNGRCTCGNTECHSYYDLGGPLSCGAGTPEEDCASAVCALDPFCCCTTWDGLCIEEAAGLHSIATGVCP